MELKVSFYFSSKLRDSHSCSPYYKDHKRDTSSDDLLTEKSHHCPLAEKCSFYKKIKENKIGDIDFSTSKCPIQNQWYDNCAFKPSLSSFRHVSKMHLYSQVHITRHSRKANPSTLIAQFFITVPSIKRTITSSLREKGANARI